MMIVFIIKDLINFFMPAKMVSSHDFTVDATQGIAYLQEMNIWSRSGWLWVSWLSRPFYEEQFHNGSGKKKMQMVLTGEEFRGI